MDELKTLIRDLTGEVAGLRRKVRTARIHALILAVVVVAVIVALVEQIQERDARRDQINQSISSLACLILGDIPDSAAPIIPPARAKYHCPPFDPDVAKLYHPTPSSTP